MSLWKLGLIVALLAAYGCTVWHVKDRFDVADKEQALETQLEDAARKQDAIQAIATATEAELATERQKNAAQTKQRIAYHAKPHTVCKLPASAIGMLQDATKPANGVSR